jgi:hypothetical protein
LSERENKVTAFCHALGRYKKRKGTGGGEEEENKAKRHSSRMRNREATGKGERADKGDSVETVACHHL